MCPSNIVIDKTPPTCNDDSYEPNDAWATEATAVSSGSDFMATKCPGNKDYYKINLNSGQKITVTLKFNGQSANLDLYLWYDQVDYNTWANVAAASYSSTASEESVSFTVGDKLLWSDEYSDAGTYYIDVNDTAETDVAGYQLIIVVE
jgi:hypothetical protein